MVSPARRSASSRVGTEQPPQWRPSAVGLAALLLGVDLRTALRLPDADRAGLLAGLLERAFGDTNVEAVLYPRPGDRVSLIDALVDAKIAQGRFPDAATAYEQLKSLLDDDWRGHAERLWSDFRAGFETVLSIQASVEGADFKAPRVPRAIGEFLPSESPVVMQGAKVLEPVQGPWSDCWLVASMAAVAWCEGNAFDGFLQQLPVEPGSVPVLRWRFPRQVRERLVRSSYPRARNGAVIHTLSASGDETWPALIEKVFAQREPRAAADDPDGPEPTLAQYRGLALHWPSKALGLLGPEDYVEQSLQLVDYLRACCKPNRAPDAPVVASTLETLRIVQDDYRIVPNHAYTVLGIDESHADRYVVLRDPYGHLHKNQRIDFDWAEFAGRPALRVGLNGVIALPQDVFRKRFRAVSVPRGTRPANA